MSILKERKALPLCKMYDGKGELVISSLLRSQKNFLHSNHKLEWCGMLLYKIVSGDIFDPTKLSIQADYIYPMGLGDHSFTEAQYGEAINDLIDIEELDGYSYAMIHSHWGMATFFSSTDVKQMDDNYHLFSPFYLSLVVNNKGEYSARITWKEDTIIKDHKVTKSLVFDNKIQEQEIIVKGTSESVVYTMDLEVFDAVELSKVDNVIGDNIYLYNGNLTYKDSQEVPKWFVERFNAIKKAYVKPIPKTIHRNPTYQHKLWEDIAPNDTEMVGEYAVSSSKINQFINLLLTDGMNKLDTISLEKIKTFKSAGILVNNPTIKNVSIYAK